VETLVRFGAVDQIQVAIAPNKEGAFYSKITIVAPLNIESLSRLLSMANSDANIACTFSSNQHALDLKLEDVRVEKDTKPVKPAIDTPAKEAEEKKLVGAGV